MDQHETNLDQLPAPILDLDVDASGGWVAVCGTSQLSTHLVFDGTSIPFGRGCRWPLIRALDPEHVVLVDRRCGSRERNGWIVRKDGTTVNEFRAGDGIQDVLVTADRIVVAYFDEAFSASDGLDGLVVFDLQGEPELRYNNSFGPAVVDCYCACAAGRGRVFFLGYPEFLGVLLDARNGTRLVWPTPSSVRGASAVTVAGDTAFFHGSYDHRHQLNCWPFGADDATVVASHTGLLRGLSSGRLLAVRPAGYTVLSLRDECGANRHKARPKLT